LKANPKEAEELFAKSEADAQRRMNFYKTLGEIMK